MVTCPLDKATLYMSAMDYKISDPGVDSFWRNLYAAMGIRFYMPGEDKTALTYMNSLQPTRTERPGPGRGFNSPVFVIGTPK